MSVIYPIKIDDLQKKETKAESEEISIKINVPAGEDDIVILRRARAENVRYSLKYLTHAPELTDEQIIEKAKTTGAMTQFQNSQAFFKLYQSLNPHGYAFYFQNDEPERTLLVNFDLQLDNLEFCDSRTDLTDFDVLIGPGGQSSFKLLKAKDQDARYGLEVNYES